MKPRLTMLLALLAAFATAAVAAVVIAAPTASAAKPGTAAVNVPVTGTASDATGQVGTFAGSYTVNRVINDGGHLAALATLTGTITTATGTQPVPATAVTVPLSAASGGASSAAVVQQLASCEILDLTLGPLDLDLLGLVVHLDTVHLNITAEQGAGNLLGNLLCAVAGLLDPPTGGGGGGLGGLLNQIVALLNQILGQL